MKLLCVSVLLALYSCEGGSSEWFLSEDEIIASRAGHPRPGIVTSSANNEMIPLIDGKAVMSSLLADFQRTKAGDSIHATMFEVNGEVLLDPLASQPEHTKITSVLIAAIQRNVSVRILVNNNIYVQTGHTFCSTINAACAHLPGKTCCAADSRHNAVGGSVHSKAWSFIFMDEVVSYVGSMDITGDRWDTPAHQNPPARQREPSDINHFHGWFGNMFRLRGTAAVDVARIFWYLWNDPAPLPITMKWYTLTPFRWHVPNMTSPPPGNLTIQTMRTVGCKAAGLGYYQKFAPVGEYSFLAGFRKMLQSAKKYVYLEDQFCFYDEALSILADALPHLDAVVIVTDNATAFSKRVAGIDVTVASNMRYYRQHVALGMLTKNATLSKKVHVYELAREGTVITGDLAKTWLYTHAKNYIADDAFMLVGSHGLERTGFTNDIEVSVGVSDGGTGPDSFVGQFRRRLWAEHLQMNASNPALMDPVSAIDLFDKLASSKLGRVRKYYPLPIRDSWAEDQVYEIYEPDGRCA